MDSKLRDLIRGEGGEAGLAVCALGGRMSVLHKVTPTTIGAAGWRAYLQNRPDRFSLDPKGPQARVRWIGG
jgi:hypothetical protein